MKHLCEVMINQPEGIMLCGKLSVTFVALRNELFGSKFTNNIFTNGKHKSLLSCNSIQTRKQIPQQTSLNEIESMKNVCCCCVTFFGEFVRKLVATRFLAQFDSLNSLSM